MRCNEWCRMGGREDCPVWLNSRKSAQNQRVRMKSAFTSLWGSFGRRMASYVQAQPVCAAWQCVLYVKKAMPSLFLFDQSRLARHSTLAKRSCRSRPRQWQRRRKADGVVISSSESGFRPSEQPRRRSRAANLFVARPWLFHGPEVGSRCLTRASSARTRFSVARITTMGHFGAFLACWRRSFSAHHEWSTL